MLLVAACLLKSNLNPNLVMTMKKLTILLTILLVSCATFKEQVNNQIDQNLQDVSSELSYRFYLIGDAGNAKENQSTKALVSLSKRLESEQDNATVLFLGDNIYQHGLPKKSSSEYDLARHRLQVQIDAVKNFKGNRIFIPGNHDYHSDGINGLKRQEKLVEEALGKGSFLPENGCAIKKVKISDEVVLIVIDTQWYLEDWDDNPNMNDNCDIKTRKDFFLEFESLIKKNRDKLTLVALHHPLFTDGAHGGNFSAKQHLFPNNKLPLPGLGTMANFIRSTGGVSSQDLQNKNYRFLVNRLTTLAQESKKVVFASGHEHSLQHIEKNNVVQIVSGSGSKVSGVKRSPESNFAYSTLGYAILDVYQDGTTQVQYIDASEAKDEVVFSKTIFKADTIPESVIHPKITTAEQKATVYEPEATIKSGFYKRMLGVHYRDAYGKEVSAPVANLDTLYGGLTPIKKGGGNQSVSLRLEDNKGRQWVMRALKKSAAQFLQINAYQEQYIKEDLKNTFIESFIEDVYTTTHPYACFIMPTLSKPIGVFYTEPKLFYVPKQPKLGVYNNDYGNALYMIEEHVGDSQTVQTNFGKPDDIISSEDLFDKLRKSPKHQIDQKLYVRSRLFDMILGDWDRHKDQWRWSKFEGKETHLYKPIPRDRDQVFSDYDGALIVLLTKMIPGLRKMQTYKKDIRDLKWHNTNGSLVDNKVLNALSEEEWLDEARFIKTHLTDEVIESAFAQFPDEVKNDQLNEVKSILKYRRDQIEEIASSYYKILNKSVILTASDKADKIQVTRLPGGMTNIKFYQDDKLYFDKDYDQEITKEIWVYALDGDDKIQVNGEGSSKIKLKIIGGQNNDTYVVDNPKKLLLFDYKSKKNNFSNARSARVRLLDDYQVNTYDYEKRKDHVKQILPNLGINKDDGFFLGIRKTLTFNNFRQNPFSHKHRIKADYFITNNGFDLAYSGEYCNVFNTKNMLFNINYTSPNYATNFFGFGNETINQEEERGVDYNRVKLARLTADLGIVNYGDQGSVFQVKALFESNRIQSLSSRFVNDNNFDSATFDRKEFVGGALAYQFKNYNDTAYPTLGMDFQFSTSWMVNVSETKQNFASLSSSYSFLHKLFNNERLVLANKTKTHVLFNTNFEFYQGATIGADDGLRGFRYQRFTGNSSLYNSTDIRYNLRKLKSGFAPMKIGLYGGFDVGRVWVKNEDSKKWHNSYGGGLWLNFAELATAQIGVFNSSEDTRISFGLGFGI